VEIGSGLVPSERPMEDIEGSEAGGLGGYNEGKKGKSYQAEKGWASFGYPPDLLRKVRSSC